MRFRGPARIAFGLAATLSAPGCGGGAESVGGEGGVGGSAGSGGTGGSAGGTGGSAGQASLYDPTYCEVVEGWNQVHASLEASLIELVNETRLAGARCGSTARPSVAALKLSEPLSCAARAHSMDMAVRDFVGHENPDEENSLTRAQRAGFEGTVLGESIATGVNTPEDVMNLWLGDSGNCDNLLNDEFSEIGAGHFPSEQAGPLWTLVLGGE